MRKSAKGFASYKATPTGHGRLEDFIAGRGRAAAAHYCHDRWAASEAVSGHGAQRRSHSDVQLAAAGVVDDVRALGDGTVHRRGAVSGDVRIYLVRGPARIYYDHADAAGRPSCTVLGVYSLHATAVRIGGRAIDDRAERAVVSGLSAIAEFADLDEHQSVL